MLSLPVLFKPAIIDWPNVRLYLLAPGQPSCRHENNKTVLEIAVKHTVKSRSGGLWPDGVACPVGRL